MTNKKLMEGTVTRNMTGRRPNNRRYSNVNGETVTTTERMVIQEPVAQVDYNVNSTTNPDTIQTRPMIIAEGGFAGQEGSLAGETVPKTEDSRTKGQDVNMAQTRPMEVKKGLTEEQKNIALFAGIVFIAVGTIALLSKYAAVK